MLADDVVTANSLATHLGCTRQNIARLTAEAVIEQRSDGCYDQSASRLKYIKHLRAEHRRSLRSEADADFQRAKAELIRLRVAKERRELMPVADHNSLLDSFAGIVLTKLCGLPARVAGADLGARRKAEAVIFELRTELANACQQRANECAEPNEP